MDSEVYTFEASDILITYPIFINVATPAEDPRYFRIDIQHSGVSGPGRFVSPLELMLFDQPHFVIQPLATSGHIERPTGRIVWASSFLVALYDPAAEDAWVIGGISGKAVFEYAEMFVVENKSARVLDKVRRDFNSYVPVLLIHRDEAGWHSKFFAADPELGDPEWLH